MADTLSDEHLLEQVAAGDAAAFSVLVRRHGSRVLALARHTLGNEADAQDIVQETFVRLWRQAERWESRGAQLSTWLHRVAMNLCLSHIERVYKRMPLDDFDQDQIEAPSPPFDESLSECERMDALRTAVAALPARQRAAITLFYSADASTAETAEALGLSVKATESLLVRARQALRAQLAVLVETWK